MMKSEVYLQIQSLKAAKRDQNDPSCATELIRMTGYVNIMDMLLLPLYFAWERMGLGTLDEVGFEAYLERAYIHFCNSITSIISQMLILLKEIADMKGLSCKSRSLVDSLIELYLTIFDDVFCHSNAK